MAVQKTEVSLKLGATLGDGDFNFRKMEVSLSVPCEVDEVTETYVAIKEWCQGNLEELIGEVRGTNPAMVETSTPVSSSSVNLDEDL